MSSEANPLFAEIDEPIQHFIHRLFHGLPALVADPYPVLVGLSRKAMIGQLTGRGMPDRVTGSITAAVLAARMGVAIVRVHDVAETAEALKVATALGAFGD